MKKYLILLGILLIAAAAYAQTVVFTSEQFGPGSVSAPSVDVNGAGGLYSPASGNLALEAGGTRFILLNSVSGASSTSDVLTLDSTLNGASASETAFSFNYTTNKAAGDDNGVMITQTDTSSPGTSILLSAFVGANGKMTVDNSGSLWLANYLQANMIQTRSTNQTMTVQDRIFTSANTAVQFATGTHTTSTGRSIAAKVAPTFTQSGVANYSAFDITVTENTEGNADNYFLRGIWNGSTRVSINSDAHIALVNSGTAPTAGNYAQFYAVTNADTVEAMVMDSAGNATEISPHRFTKFSPPAECSSPWSYYSENTITGKGVNVDMCGALKALEDLTGETFVYEFDLPQTETWEQYQARIKPEIDRQEREKWITAKLNDAPVEISEEDAFETIEEIVYTDKIVGYETRFGIVNGSVTEYQQPIHDTKSVQTKRLKAGVKLDETTGNLYKYKTREELEVLAPAYAPTYAAKPAPKWISDRAK